MIRLDRAAPLLVLLLPLAGCVFHRPASQPSAPKPEERLQQALTVLDSGDYAGATRQLLALSQGDANSAVGRAALLSAAAAELDPRNPDRQLDQGATLLASYLQRSPPGDWTEHAVESFYLLAQEVGASSERIEQAQAAAARARAEAGRVPRLPGAPLSQRLEDVQRDRDRLATRVKELESTSADLRKQYADTLQELQRIRRTLRP